MLFRLIGRRSRFESALRFTHQFSVLPVHGGYEFGCLVEHLRSVGIFRGHEVCDLFEDFREEGGILCVVHGSSFLDAIEVDSAYEAYYFLRSVSSARQSGSPVIQGSRELVRLW